MGYSTRQDCGFEEAPFMPAGLTVTSVVLGLVFTWCAYGTVMNWKFYASNEFGYYQYDAEDVRRLASGLVRVRQKLVLSYRGATHLIQKLGKEYENTKEIITLREIDCAGQKSRIRELMYHSGNGVVIKRESYDPGEWDVIIPDSVDDVLYQNVCGQP